MVYLYHPESDSYLCMDQQEYFATVQVDVDLALCVEISRAEYIQNKQEETVHMNELTIPEAANVPAYLRDPQMAKQANEDAAAGISTGAPARIKLNGKQFMLVDGNGKASTIPPDRMVAGPDGSLHLSVLILRAKKSLSKLWYASAYNPAIDDAPPDCFSHDGERPDASVLVKQADVCASCPHNAFGSGVDQQGNATKGKACADVKILAVFVPWFGVHQLRIPPASLKNFGLYVKQLSSSGIAIGVVKTLLGFDATASFPALLFNFGGFVSEELVPKLVELSQSSDVEDIISPRSVAPKVPAAQAAPAQTQAAPAETVTPTPMTEPVADALDIDLTVNTPAPAQAAPAQTQAAPAVEAVSDDDLKAQLGL